MAILPYIAQAISNDDQINSNQLDDDRSDNDSHDSDNTWNAIFNNPAETISATPVSTNDNDNPTDDFDIAANLEFNRSQQLPKISDDEVFKQLREFANATLDQNDDAQNKCIIFIDSFKAFHAVRVNKSVTAVRQLLEKLQAIKIQYSSGVFHALEPNAVSDWMNFDSDQLQFIAENSKGLFKSESHYLKGSRILTLSDAWLHISKFKWNSNRLMASAKNDYSKAYTDWQVACSELKAEIAQKISELEDRKQEWVQKENEAKTQLSAIRTELKQLRTLKSPPAPRRSDYE